jgi:hypothetical protein
MGGGIHVTFTRLDERRSLKILSNFEVAGNGVS